MGFTRAQAWLTYVTRNDHVTWALVLAESLRRTRTIKRIGVITCGSVSSKGRTALRHAFDDVFLLDESGNGKDSEFRAKIFAFSLDIFEKCIFLEPNSLVLENGDKLFEGRGQIVSLIHNPSDQYHSDYYLITPCRHFSEYLAREYDGGNKWLKNSFLSSCLKIWRENNSAVDEETENTSEEGRGFKNCVAQFSIKEGHILNGESWNAPALIQFVDGPSDNVDYVSQLKTLKSSPCLGLTEKAIIQVWLKVYEEGVIQSAKDRIPPGISGKETTSSYSHNEPIAIIGISCRLPGANNLEEFWNLLHAGQDAVREPPAYRWRKEHSVTPVGEKERKTNVGFLSTTVDEFDAKFFGVSPKEAVFMDPQTRLLHEVMWESLENGGVDPSTLYGSHTGIFTGSWMNDYRDIVQWSTSRDFFRGYLGNSIGASAARLSHLLGLTGPCIATESGCSSAIVAVDMAVKSLRRGETHMALAGGVNVLLHPFTTDIMDFVISPDGKCKTFDAKADGFGRAEGCGFLVMKRLSDALRDKDNIWAVIRGSALSQEGVSRSLGTPTVHCEALAMQLALQDAGVRPEQVTFVETHGTGTSVGDPMEVAAIAKAYHAKGRKDPLVIGSVKTNVGHTESCSGITGIIKTVLALQHEMIPQHLNLDTLNPNVNLNAIPAVIPMDPIPWPKVEGQPRFAGVSSFGITGTDGHVILEEAPDYQLPKFTVGIERPMHILKISAKTNEALDQLVKKYEESFAVERSHEEIFADFAFTANTGRASFDNRAFILASNFQEASSSIEQSKLVRGTVAEAAGKICFLFTGQGSQYPGMAQSLYETSPVFRYHFDHCDRTLKETYNVSIRQALWESDPGSKELSRTIFSQTSIFCVEYCLLKLWKSWGLQPDYVLGHSLGEFCATVAAGILSFQDALRLVAVRSQLIDQLPRGSMLVLKASQKQVEDAIKAANIPVEFAALNSADQTVVAGDTDKISELLAYCKGQGMKGVILEATHAFHSSHMDAMLDEYRKAAQSITYKNPVVQYVSGLEGKVVQELSPEYWVRHTREKVNFLQACQTLKQLDCHHFLEVGPQPVLSTFVMQNLEDSQISCYPSLRRNTTEWETILTSLGKLWIDGFKIDWEGFDKQYSRKKVTTLPFYPFHRKSFWVECNEVVTRPIHPLVGAQLSNASNLTIFQNDLNVNVVPYLRDHCIGTRMVFPGAGFTEMCLTAGYCVANFLKENLDKPRRPLALENVNIQAPLELKDGKFCRLQVLVDLPDQEEMDKSNGLVEELEEDETQGGANKKRQGFRCKVFHRNNSDNEMASGKWVPHATATFYPVVGNATDLLQNWNGERIKELIASKDPLQMDGFYKRIDGVGLKFGESFRSLQKQWLFQQEDADGGMDEIVAEVKVPVDFEKYLLHPLIIDAMFQTQIIAGIRTSKSEALRVPVHIGKLILFNSLEAEGQCENNSSEAAQQSVLYIHAKCTKNEKCSVFVSNQNFVPLVLMEDVELLETNVKTIQSVLEQQNSQIPEAWEEYWKAIPGPEDKRIDMMDVTLVTCSKGFEEKIQDADKTVPEDKVLSKKVDRLVCLYTLRALYQLGWQPKYWEEFSVQEFCAKYKIIEAYHQLVYFYCTMLYDELGMVGQVANSDADPRWRVKNIPYKNEEEVTAQVDQLYNELIKERVGNTVKIYENVANNLTKVLTGEESPLPILFPMEPEKQELSAENYYLTHSCRDDVISKTRATWQSLWQAISEYNGGQDSKRIIRAMEVGAGTGSMTLMALQEMRKIFGNRFEFYYTDISASFFAKADKRLEEFRPNIKYMTFNIEESPLSQGIPVNYFDCVTGADVLHATRNLKESLNNLRMTLRPQGILSFTDTLIQDKGITFSFGLLSGYWRFEDFETRPHHTCVDAQTWKDLLLENGFNYVHTCECYNGLVGCITAEGSSLTGYDQADVLPPRMLKGSEDLMEKKKRWIIFSPEEETDVMLKVTKILEIGGNKVDVVLPSAEMETEDAEKWAKIFNGGNEEGGDEVQGIVYAWGMKNDVCDQKKFALPFMHIAKYVLANEKKPPRLYVIVRDVCHVLTEDSKNPSPATLFGMAKSLKNENPDLFVRCVDMDGSSDPDTLINDILFELAMHKESKEKERMQVAYRKGSRYEPRLNRLPALQSGQTDLQLPPSTNRFELVLPETRVISDLTFGVLEEKKMGDDEVEVSTRAFALNFRDIFAILKPTPEFEKINGVGLDYAGVIIKVGKAVEKFKVGDHVFGVNQGLTDRLPSHLISGVDPLLKMPPKMTFTEAATLPAVFLTSIYCLIIVAELKKEDTVLIHTGSGGVGLSAILLAQRVGANIIVTAGSPRKKAYLRSIGIKHVFHSRNTSYQEEIMKVTNGRGVDVLLNSLTGPGFKEASLAVCAQNAKFIEMSKLGVWTEQEVKDQRPDVQYTIADLAQVDKPVWKDLLAKTEEYMDEGVVCPIPFVKFDALRIRQALQFFQKAKHIGKVVVTMPEVKAEHGQWQVKVSLFNGDSTYLITGGLGGIGFEVCKWMLEKGATDIVLMGRNPPKPEVVAEIERLNKRPGNNVMIKLCDVGNYDDCKKIINELSGCKPIRGVQHCAGVLWDNLYENQTWESFSATFNPKVEGTWNLHRLLKDAPLEHFVLYSSFASLVGTPGQANHAAANSFEDSFAHHRYSLGLPATSINWGQWAQVGCAKEVNLVAVMPVSMARMLNGLEEALRSQRLQVAYAEFENLNTWTIVCPSCKAYLDERLLKSLSDSSDKESQTYLLQSAKFWQEIDEAQTTQAKMDVVTGYMKAILRSALRMDPDEPIKDDANMQDLGVDSLMLIELRNSIQGLMGSRLTVSANMLKDCHTIRQLATVIVNKIEDTDQQDLINAPPLSPEEMEQLLKEDCVLDESIQPEKPYEKTALKSVFVTGATGQLGPYILSWLCRLPTLEKITCLVRTKEDASPQDRLAQILESMKLTEKVDMSKVECLRGDVLLPNFGLEQEVYDQLCESVDGVIHLAVKSNHVEPYRKIEGGAADGRTINVGGTLAALRFAVARKTKCLYYASSILTVIRVNEEGALCDDWPELEHTKIMAENGVTAYPASKFICETLMMQANERGVPCKVFRFPWIMGESESGRLNFQNNHYILRFMTYLKIKSMPSGAIPAIVLPVDICADWSMKLFCDDNAPCRAYNIVHPSPKLEVEFVQVAKEVFETDIELVEWDTEKGNTTFLEKLYATDMPMESMKEIYQDLDRIITVTTSKTFQAIQGYLNCPDTFFGNKTLEKYMPGFSQDLPSSTDIIRMDLEYARSMGYFSRFGL